MPETSGNNKREILLLKIGGDFMKKAIFLILILVTTPAWADNKKEDEKNNKTIIETNCSLNQYQVDQITNSIKLLKSENLPWYRPFVIPAIVSISIFILGLFSDSIKKRLFDKASIELVFDKTDDKCIRKFSTNGNITDIDYRIMVKNNTKFLWFFKKNVRAMNCSIRISILNITIENVKNDVDAYIVRNNYSPVKDEYILWDFNYEGKNPYLLNILPQSHDMAVFAHYRNNEKGIYWEIPSENRPRPKICVTADNLKLKITILP